VLAKSGGEKRRGSRILNYIHVESAAPFKEIGISLTNQKGPEVHSSDGILGRESGFCREPRGLGFYTIRLKKKIPRLSLEGDKKKDEGHRNLFIDCVAKKL